MNFGGALSINVDQMNQFNSTNSGRDDMITTPSVHKGNMSSVHDNQNFGPTDIKHKMFKIHAILPLSLMKLSAVDDSIDRSGCSFIIHAPEKSFMVTASNPDEKRHWYREISNAIKTIGRQRKQDRESFSGERFEEMIM